MKKIAIVGTISNAERHLEPDLKRLLRACSDFEVALVYLVESDSIDGTKVVLQRLSSEVQNFHYISLGVLGNQIPDRIARIRHCRNRYVEELRRLNILVYVDYVFVADLDGMNSKISRTGVRSSFSREGWSVVLANQLGGYYDLLALRHATWCPTDILRELRSEQDMIEKSNLSRFSIMKRGKRRLEFDRARKKVIYSRMRMISTSSDWIDVDSGFGGLGIYRSEVFADFDYTLKAEDAVSESEHVALSNRIVQSGGKIFINPRMINNFFNTYNINRIFAIRQIREIYWNSLKWLKPLFKRS